MTYLPSGPFSLSSMTSCSIFRPVTSVIDLMVMPSNSRPNEWPTELSRSGRAMMPYLSGTVSPGRRRLLADQAGAAGELGEPEDDELGGLDRGDPDLADHLARIDALGRVGFPVALDVERLVRGQPEQRPAPPLVDQEGADGPADPRPQRVVVGLEHHPLRSVEDGFLEVVEQPTDVQVPPGRVRGQRPGAVDPDPAGRERPDAVDPERVEQPVLVLGDLRLQGYGAADHLVGRRLVHPARIVVAPPHPATCPDGGTKTLRPVGGSNTLTHGQYSAAYFES